MKRFFFSSGDKIGYRQTRSAALDALAQSVHPSGLLFQHIGTRQGKVRVPLACLWTKTIVSTRLPNCYFAANSIAYVP